LAAVIAGAATAVIAGAATVVIAGATTVVIAGAATVVIAGAATVVIAGVTTAVIAGATTVVIAGATTVVIAGVTTAVIARSVATKQPPDLPTWKLLRGARDDGRECRTRPGAHCRLMSLRGAWRRSNLSPMHALFFVYILTNRNHTVLYTGVTNNLVRRVYEHREKVIPGFTSRYNVSELVFYEATPDVRAAIAREKQIKGDSRSKKITLIVAMNPDWRDLYEDLAGSWRRRLPRRLAARDGGVRAAHRRHRPLLR
jgi:putative endonuclease